MRNNVLLSFGAFRSLIVLGCSRGAAVAGLVFVFVCDPDLITALSVSFHLSPGPASVRLPQQLFGQVFVKVD